MRAVVQLLVALCCVLGSLASARAEKRVVLIVGNSAYAHIAGLPNVPSDANAMAALFKAANFDAIDVLSNLDVGQLRRALKMFAAKAADADVAVLFYAGHGIEVGQTNYLIPVDARLATDFDVEDETVPLDRVLQAMEPARRLRLVLLDACRENPFLKSMKRTVATRSVGRGLSRVEPATANTLIAFATKPNAIAGDGKGPNSPFTAALVRHLLTPGLDLRIALGKVRDEVMASTGGRQEPYVTSSLGGDVVAIVPGVPGGVSPTLVPRPNEAAEAWAGVKDSTSIAQLEVISGRYKGTVYADLAQARIAELKKQHLALAIDPATNQGPLRAAVPLTAAEERALRPKGRFKECDMCPEMVVVPAGTFLMGPSPAEIAAFSTEDDYLNRGPQRRVTILRPFAVGKFEITFAEWDACVASGGCRHRPDDAGWGRDKRPVINVSWNDITNEYLPWLNRTTGKVYRLLTEEEWEYTARGVTNSSIPAKRYWWGDSASHEYANYGKDQCCGGMKQGHDQWEFTAPVGQFAPNPFSLHDMHGNVEEWVQDCGSFEGACLVRDGSWYAPSKYLRSANRGDGAPSVRNQVFGFRVARTL